MNMNNEIEPAAGQWYQDLVDGDLFQVVSVDEEGATVELQYFDGDVEELDIDEWRGMDLEATDPPEDWTGPIDDVEREDMGFSEERSHGERRGLAEERRRAALQNPESGGQPGTLSERRPADEERESELTDGTERAARDEQRPVQRDVE